MAEARRSDQWDHTAFLLAMLRNCKIDPKKDTPSKVEDFHPFARKKERVIAKIKPSMIADAIRRRNDERRQRNQGGPGVRRDGAE